MYKGGEGCAAPQGSCTVLWKIRHKYNFSLQLGNEFIA